MAKIPKQRKLPNPRWGGLHHPGINEQVQRALDTKKEMEDKQAQEVNEVKEDEQNKEAEAVAEQEDEKID